MRINAIQQNPNFKGYKNLICDMYEDKPQSKFAFITLQLTDDGQNDLAIWNKIQKDLLHKEPKDTITFQMVETPRGSNLYIADSPLDIRLYKDLPNDEKLALKTYSLLASLTKRIMSYSITTTDADMPRVLWSAREDIGKFLFNSIDEVNQIVYHSFLKNITDHKIAGLFNKTIQKKMVSYFK